MKILHYIPSIDRTSGGVGSYMQLLSVELGKVVELHVITHKSANELHLQNCTLHYISNKWLPVNTTRKEFENLLDEIKPDVFHTNCCWLPLSAMTLMWAKKLGYSTVYTPHGMLEPWIMQRHYWSKKFPALLLFQRKGIVKADMIHATAESEKQNLLRLGYNEKIEVIPNCVEVDKIVMKTSWERKKKILFLSRVHVKKGINFLIEAVAQLKGELQGYIVCIAGEGDESYVAELKQQTLLLGVSHLIHFVGGVYGDQKWELYQEADVFVLPTHSENFGIVVLEALASGTPVLTTKGTPWKELEDCHCGWWIEVGTKALVKALRDFLQFSESELEGYGRRGRELVEERYSTKAVASQFFEMYKYLTLVKSM